MRTFEQDSVESCVDFGTITVNQSDYPWINNESADVSTALVTLKDGTCFRFGSLIGLNGSIEKIAQDVPLQDSLNTQSTLFMGLPEILQGRVVPGISKVENYRLSHISLFTASRQLVRAAGLVFTISPQEKAKSAEPTVFRVGISTPKHRQKLLSVLDIEQPGGHRRKK